MTPSKRATNGARSSAIAGSRPILSSPTDSAERYFIRPHISGYEGTLWVDGVPYGNFSTKIVFTGHGNHYCDLLKRTQRQARR